MILKLCLCLSNQESSLSALLPLPHGNPPNPCRQHSDLPLVPLPAFLQLLGISESFVKHSPHSTIIKYLAGADSRGRQLTRLQGRAEAAPCLWMSLYHLLPPGRQGKGVPSRAAPTSLQRESTASQRKKDVLVASKRRK